MKHIATVLCVGLLAVTGCRFGDSDAWTAADGSAGTIASELTNMGATAENLLVEQGSAKRNARADTVTIEVLEPWAYNATGGCWTRKAQATFANGVRLAWDTLCLKDATSAAVQNPVFSAVASYTHKRVSQSTGTNSNTIDFVYDMAVTVTRGADTTLTFNGDITGSLNGTTFGTTTATNVVCPWSWSTVPRLGLPTSGSISIDRPLRTLTIAYDGDSTVNAVVTRKRDDKEFAITVNVETGEES